jgi:ribosome-interacting GTPase 1
MPANLTPQYLAAEKRFKEAATLQEKIEALEEMMATIPKHKGTEKMRAELRRRMAKLNAEKDKKYETSKAGGLFSVQKEGAGQAALIGAANTGKSALLARLTNATPEVADYPFTTHMPQPGMLPFENIKIQLVDMPAIAPEFYKPWMGSIVRHADLALLVADLGSDGLLNELEMVIEILSGAKIRLVGSPTAETGDEADSARCTTLLLANKLDLPEAADNLEVLRELYQERFDILPVSALSGAGVDAVAPKAFEMLGIVRVHTKAPGKKVDLAATPFVLKRGSTVWDAARAVHRDFVQTLKYARVWSPECSRRAQKYDGQMVERTYQLEDGDILELHG